VTTKEYISAACGKPIDAYSYAGATLKAKWLQHGRYVARKLAKELGLVKGQFQVRTNPAGVAVSGDVHLHADWVYVALEQGGIQGMFMWRYCDSQKDYTGHANQWAPWSALEDLPKFAKYIRDGKKEE